jgi:hypothetical protein
VVLKIYDVVGKEVETLVENWGLMKLTGMD